MQKNGQWNPPQLSSEVAMVWNDFNRLSMKRSRIQAGMNGIIGEEYISETELTAYLSRNPPVIDLDWYQSIFYAFDEEYIKFSRKDYSDKAEQREKMQKLKKGKR